MMEIVEARLSTFTATVKNMPIKTMNETTATNWMAFDLVPHIKYKFKPSTREQNLPIQPGKIGFKLFVFFSINPHTLLAQKVADEVVFRRFQGEGVEFFFKSDLTYPLRFLMPMFWKIPIKVFPAFIFQWRSKRKKLCLFTLTNL